MKIKNPGAFKTKNINSLKNGYNVNTHVHIMQAQLEFYNLYEAQKTILQLDIPMYTVHLTTGIVFIAKPIKMHVIKDKFTVQFKFLMISWAIVLKGYVCY